MNAKQKVEIQAQLDSIEAGKNYPMNVDITETYKGKKMKTTFHLVSYFVGMYCAIYCNGAIATQTGDNNNKTFVAKLKKDISSAIKRGATVEIGAIHPIKVR